jgi:predicted MFS family arabinose efflux permease
VAAVSALIPSVANTFKVDEFLVGRIVWLYMLAYGLSALLYGPLTRSVDCKKILLYCTGIYCLANLASGLALNIHTLFIARLLAGISGAAIIPLSLILVGKISSPQERGKQVGRFFSLTFISSLLGLFLSGLLFWRWIFLIPAIGAALVCLGIYFYFPELYFAEGKLRFSYLQVLSDKRVLGLFVYIFCASFLYHGVRQWLGVYFFKVYAFEQFLISILLTTVSLSGIFGESLGGILSDRVGRIKIVNLGAGLMLIALTLLLFKNTLFLLFLIMFAWGLGWTFNHAAVSTRLTDLPHQYLYESASLNSSVRFLSGGVGAVIGGALARIDFNLNFITFAFCLVALLIFGKKLIIKED